MTWSQLHRSALLIAVLGGAADAGAQAAARQDQPFAPGARVRIHRANSKSHTATVYALRGDTLLLSDGNAAEPWVFPLAAATSIDVSRGRRSRTLRGALVGLLGGGLISGFTTYVVTDDPPCEDTDFCLSFDRERKALVAGLVGGVVGAVAGGVFGARHPSERWERVHPPPGVHAPPRPEREP